jgi:ABC-type multidrug transport system permease subunit
MNRAFRNLVALQFKEFFREPEIIFWAFVLPIVLAWLLGVAIGSSNGLTRTVGAVESDEAPREYWEEWIANAQAALAAAAPDTAAAGEGARDDAGGISFRVLSRDEAILALKKGKISLFVERGPAGEGVRYSFDPRNGEARMTHLLVESALGGGGAATGNTVAALEVQGTRYIDYLVPGLLAMDIMSSVLWGIGWVLIEIRIKKLLRRMAATPMHKSMFLFSHFTARLIVNAIEFLALFLFARWYFGVRVQGSVPALVAVFIAGSVAFTGIAIFVSSRTANPRVGNGLINAVTFPMMLLSGIFFSYNQFPEWSIKFVKVLPLTMLADAMRSIFNEGAGFAEVGVPALILVAVGCVFFAAGMKMYKWY